MTLWSLLALDFLRHLKHLRLYLCAVIQLPMTGNGKRYNQMKRIFDIFFGNCIRIVVRDRFFLLHTQTTNGIACGRAYAVCPTLPNFDLDEKRGKIAMYTNDILIVTYILCKTMQIFSSPVKLISNFSIICFCSVQRFLMTCSLLPKTVRSDTTLAINMKYERK